MLMQQTLMNDTAAPWQPEEHLYDRLTLSLLSAKLDFCPFWKSSDPSSTTSSVHAILTMKLFATSQMDCHRL
jgi:hypothetical protein